jgi:predicted DNA-binding antitoxin AbrB/MazE fold protein
MKITIEAIYEAGVLKPLEPLGTLKDPDRVRINVQSVGLIAEQRQQRIRIDTAVAQGIAESPEYDLLAE